MAVSATAKWRGPCRKESAARLGAMKGPRREIGARP
jgi:hypothetical protein